MPKDVPARNTHHAMQLMAAHLLAWRLPTEGTPHAQHTTAQHSTSSLEAHSKPKKDTRKVLLRCKSPAGACIVHNMQGTAREPAAAVRFRVSSNPCWAREREPQGYIKGPPVGAVLRETLHSAQIPQNYMQASSKSHQKQKQSDWPFGNAPPLASKLQQTLCIRTRPVRQMNRQHKRCGSRGLCCSWASESCCMKPNLCRRCVKWLSQS